MSTDFHRFEGFELQAVQRRLLIGGEPVALGARAFDVLRVLATRAGDTVSKSELFDLVWPNVVVEENNLQVHISALRKLLGPQTIATIPGRGYRLTAERRDGPATTPGVSAAPEGGVVREDRGSQPSPAVLNLPPLLGRADELADIVALVRAHPLVSIVGAGGIGKTRLAHAVLHELQGEFADGVHMTELAPLADPALVVSAVARATGLPPVDGHDAIEALVRLLKGRRMLVVLDNCEHVLEAVSALIDALRRGASEVHLLTTSQELLRSPDEHVYRLSPLAVPGESTLERARRAGAVELFVERARSAQPGFALDDGNVGAVVEICRRLDGIALAIELAAARVPLLGVTGVRDRLDERFRFLTAGSRLALRRHQTLRAALEWSYGLLSEVEQRVFDLLGVFAGSFSLQSAQQMASSDDEDEWVVLERLSAIVDKSLMVVERGDPPRYRLLETTRAYALERLAARGATPAAMRRHAEVTLAVFRRCFDEHVHHKPPSVAAREYAPDQDNLRSALRWACSPEGDRRLAIELFGKALVNLLFQNSARENYELSRQVMPLIDETSDPEAVAWACFAAAELDWASTAEAIDYAQRGAEIFRRLGNRLGEYVVVRAVAYTQVHSNPEASRKALERLLELRDAPELRPWHRTMADHTATSVLTELGETSRAVKHAEDHLAAVRALGMEDDLWQSEARCIELKLITGNVEAAVSTTRSALARYPYVRGMVWDGSNLRAYGTALVCAGFLDEAEPVYRKSLDYFQRHVGRGAALLFDAATLLAKRGRIDDAARLWAHAAAIIRPRALARHLDGPLLEMFALHHSDKELARLYEEGRALTDDQACALAFP